MLILSINSCGKLVTVIHYSRVKLKIRDLIKKTVRNSSELIIRLKILMFHERINVSSSNSYFDNSGTLPIKNPSRVE